MNLHKPHYHNLHFQSQTGWKFYKVYWDTYSALEKSDYEVEKNLSECDKKWESVHNDNL